MSSLENYLRGQYQQDKQQIETIRKVIDEVLPVFFQNFGEVNDGKVDNFKTWPYTVTPPGKKTDTKETEKRFSFSTHSMILFTLDAVTQRSKDSVLISERVRPHKLKLDKDDRTKLFDTMRTGKQDLVRLLAKGSDPLVSSRTYGDNDPFTLTWLAELAYGCKATEDEIDPKKLDECKKGVVKAAEKVFKRKPNALLEWTNNQNHYEIEHSFLKLRCLQLAKATGYVKHNKLEPFSTTVDRQSLEGTVHCQLGYFSVPDSRFDPAELVFATEAVLQLDGLGLNKSTIDRVFATLQQSQEHTPYWRPVSPFLGTEQGMVLFPVSVEIVNSLLRTCDILDDVHKPTYFSRIEALLRRYTQWIIARIERFTGDKGEVAGWHSEHVNQRGLIHLWETSQVLLFLIHYASMLQRKIAADGFEHAGLVMRDWRSIKDLKKSYWQGEPLEALSKVGGTSSRDPADRHYAVLDRIYEDFIKKSSCTSLMLYGPPGTGKTTVAEQMAVRLQRPLLTITVSDFLAGGAAEVEARAKGVFQVLEEQEDIIILLDELDQFLLDRNSAAYKTQTGIFQFLTPGMLTKLQNLKDLGRSIFIVATNYEERIDSAIKRQGRFDRRLLLSLPDMERRKEFLWRFLCDKLTDRKKKSKEWETFRNGASGNNSAKELIDAVEKAKKSADLEANNAEKKKFADHCEHLLKETVFFGWGDLRHLVENELKIEPGNDWKKIITNLEQARTSVQPSVKLSAYQGRFNRDEQSPFEEFAILLYLFGEVISDAIPDDKKTIKKASQLKKLNEIKNLIPASQKVRDEVYKKMKKYEDLD